MSVLAIGYSFPVDSQYNQILAVCKREILVFSRFDRTIIVLYTTQSARGSVRKGSPIPALRKRTHRDQRKGFFDQLSKERKILYIIEALPWAKVYRPFGPYENGTATVPVALFKCGRDARRRFEVRPVADRRLHRLERNRRTDRTLGRVN